MGRKSPLDPNDPTKQHLDPLSRKRPPGGRRTQNGLPEKKRVAYDTLFGNRFPYEVIEVLLTHLLQPGEFQPYEPLIDEEEGVPETLPPDDLLLLLISQHLPKDWIPGKQLMEELERRRK